MDSKELRELIDSLPHFVLIFDRAARVVDANRPILEYLERDLEELRELGPEPICRKTHPDDIKIFAEECRRIREESLPFDSERRISTEDGSYRWHLFRYKPMHDDTGQISRWLCTATDIEETKHDEEIRHSLLDVAPTFLHTAGPDGIVEYLNERWIDYLGIPLSAILDRTRQPAATSVPNPTPTAPNLVATIHPEDLPGFAEEWLGIVASGESGQFEARIRRFDGLYRWFLFQAAPVFDRQSKVTKWYIASIDIDERKRAQDELQKRALEAAEQFRIAIDATPGLGWTAGPDGSADFLSRGWLEYAGLSMEEALGWGFMVSIHPDDLAHGMAAYRAALRTGEMFETEVRVRRNDGEYRWFLFRGNALRDAAGNIVKWFGNNTDIEDRKKADDALKESEQSLRMIVESIPGLVHTLTPTGELQMVSQQELDYFGKTLDQLKDWEKLVHPDDLGWVSNYWKDLLITGSFYDAEIRLLRADGIFRWIHVQGAPLRNETNQVIRWYFLMTDIDERKKALEKISQSERYLVEGQRLSRTGSFSWKVLTQQLPYLSEECLRIFGFDPDKGPISSHQGHEIIVPEHRARCMEVIQRARAERAPWEMEYPIVTSQGTRKYVRSVAHPMLDAAGELDEYVGTVIDITEQHKAQEAMRETERHLTLLIETIPAHVWTARQDGSCIYVNQQHRDYVGCSNEDLLAMNWSFAMHPDDIEKTLEAWRHSVQTGERYGRTQRVRRFDGVYRWFQTIAVPLRDEQGKVTQWYGLNIDIDDARNLEETLRVTRASLSRATAIATVAELSASIAHEINQPLGAVVANGDACELWLSANPPNVERALISVQRIIRDGKDAAEVVQRMRALFKEAVPNKSPLVLNEIVTVAMGLHASDILDKKVTVESKLTPDLPTIYADKVQMQQLFVNLLHNAIEAMETVQDRPRVLTVESIMDTSGAVLVSIGDRGSGLEDAERIFEPFFTTKEEGMGMGLAISRSIVDAHGGSLHAIPNHPQGTVFIVTFPAEALALSAIDY